MVFMLEDFQTNDPNHAWDDKRDCVTFIPVVFAYLMIWCLRMGGRR